MLPEDAREARRLYSKAGDALGQANCTMCLGDTALVRADHDEPARKRSSKIPSY